MHTNSPVTHIQSPVASFSSLTSFSTPVDKVGCAKIHKFYLRNCLSVRLQILQHSQSNMALWLSQILTMWPKALSSSIASVSIPIAKAEYAKIHGLERSKQKRFDLSHPICIPTPQSAMFSPDNQFPRYKSQILALSGFSPSVKKEGYRVL